MTDEEWAKLPDQVHAGQVNIVWGPVADRVRGPMEIRDRPKLADWQLVDAVGLLRRLLDPESCSFAGAGFVGITPEDIRIDTFVALSEAEAEFLLRLRGFDDVYIRKFFSR